MGRAPARFTIVPDDYHVPYAGTAEDRRKSFLSDELFWSAALSDERHRENRVAVAERGGGTAQVEGGVREIRMVRGMRRSP